MNTHTILALSDTAQLALIGILSAFVLAITPAIVALLMSISRKLDRVEKQTNGRLSEAESRVKAAEAFSPGLVDQKIPVGHELIVTRAINNPLTADPPVEISRITTPAPSPPPKELP